MKRRVLSTVIAVGLGLGLSATSACTNSDAASDAVTAPSGSAPASRTTGTVPSTKPGGKYYGTYLAEHLDTGKCRVLVAIPSEAQRTAAQTYVQGNKTPTAACPKPDVAIMVTTTYDTGQLLNGRYVINYTFTSGSGGGPRQGQRGSPGD